MIEFIITQLHRLKRLISWFIPRTKKQFFITAFFGILSLAVFFGLADGVSAQNTAVNVGAQGVNWIIRLMSEILLWLARIFISMTVFGLKLFIEVAKYNGYVDAPIVIIGWTMVRDIANMFFVVVMLLIAFGTILGLEQYEWKKTLVNFILAAVFVNFSKLIAGLIIDIAHVFTITFLNAIVATAGGNLVNMLHLDQILQIVGNDLSYGQDIGWEVFGGAVMAMTFAGIAMMAIGGYTIVMVMRLVLLWVAIILSPLAYIFAVIPQTKSYADEWWSEFGKHVLVAPVIVFFMWLAFSALGQGNFAGADLNLSLEGEKQAAAAVGIQDTGGPTSVSISKVSSWENMANFFIAVAFLIVGLERVQKIGARGSSFAGDAVDFGKKAALYGSLVGAGLWASRGARDLATKGAEGAAVGTLKHLPVVGGEKIKRYAATAGQGIRGLYYGKGMEVTEKGEEIRDALQKDHETLANLKDGGAGLKKEIATLEKARESAEGDQAAEIEKKLGEKKSELAQVASMGEEQKQALQEKIATQEKELSKEMGGGFIGWMARKNIQSQKRLGKTEKQADVRRDLLWKRTGSQAGGYFIGLGKIGDRYKGVDAQDRIERGWLAAESMRSKAKDEEFENLGRGQVLANARYKFDVNGSKFFGMFGTTPKYEFSKGTMAERISERKNRAERIDSTIRKIEGEAHLRMSLGKVKLQRQYKDIDGGGKRVVKPDGSVMYEFTDDDTMRAKAEAKMIADTVSAVEEREIEEHLIDMYQDGDLLDKGAQDIERGRFSEDMKAALAREDELGEELSTIQAREVTVEGVDGPTSVANLIELEKTARKAQVDAQVAAKNKKSELTKNAADRLIQRDADLKEIIKQGNDDKKKRAEIEKKDKRTKSDKAWLQTPAAASNPDRVTQIEDKDNRTEEEIAWLAANTVQEIEDRITAAKTELEAIDTDEKKKELIKAEVEADNELTALNTDVTDKKDAAREQSRIRRAAEEVLKEETAGEYDTAKQKLKNHEKEMNELREKLKEQGEMVRLGDTKTIQEIIDTLTSSLTGKSEAAQVDIQKDIKAWQKLLKGASSGSLAWRYGAQKGLQKDRKDGYTYQHNYLLSEAEQRVVHDERGLDTPKSTLTELIEQYTKSFSEMSIESFVANAGDMLVKMLDKQEKETLTSQDKAVMMGLFKRGFDRAWIDDAIYAITGNKEANRLIGEKLGWDDDEYVDDKIRDIQMLLASGVDVDFVRNNGVISQIKDVAEMDFKLNMKQMEKGLTTGKFVDKAGKDITKAIHDKVLSFMKDNDMKFNVDQEMMFADFFSGVEEAQTKARERIDKRLANMGELGKSEEFIAEVTKRHNAWSSRTDNASAAAAVRESTYKGWIRKHMESQSEMQFLGNLRPDALKVGHAENAGWALSSKMADGSNLYLGTGMRRARRHVMGDALKMRATDRTSFQTHSYANLTESQWGQMITSLRLDDYLAIRGNTTDPNTFRNTNARDRLLRAGLSSIDKVDDYTDENNTFEVAMLRHKKGAKKGQLTNLAQNWAVKYKQWTGNNFDELSDDMKQAFIVQQTMQKNFGKQMSGNIKDFLMTLSEMGGVDMLEAFQQGKMNIRMYNPAKGEMVKYDNVQKLIEHYNNGDFHGKVNHETQDYEKVSGQIADRISKFIPKKAGKGGDDASDRLAMGLDDDAA